MAFAAWAPMSKTYPNIVPENDLRLPDSLTIKHGPAGLLARFILQGDKAARRAGLRLRLRTDFPALVELNRRYVPEGTWFPIANTFNPDYTELSPENSFWVCGEDERGEPAATFAGRIYYWPDTNLEEQAYAMFYGTEPGRECWVTAQAAKRISGVVFSGGAAWVRPDYRGHQLSRLFPRIGKAYASTRWPLDWAMGYVSRRHIERGIADGWYGHKHLGYSVFYPGAPWGNSEAVIVYSAVEEIYEDLADFMRREWLGSADEASERDRFRKTRDETVTKVSSKGVLQGSSNLS
jgi:hypothetical protein